MTTHTRTFSTGIILCMRPANGRRRCNVTASPIGLGHTQNDPCKYCRFIIFNHYVSLINLYLTLTSSSGLTSSLILWCQRIPGHVFHTSPQPWLKPIVCLELDHITYTRAALLPPLSCDFPRWVQVLVTTYGCWPTCVYTSDVTLPKCIPITVKTESRHSSKVWHKL